MIYNTLEAIDLPPLLTFSDGPKLKKVRFHAKNALAAAAAAGEIKRPVIIARSAGAIITGVRTTIKVG